MAETVGRILAIRELEVKDAYRVYILQTIVPAALGSLLTYWSRGIVDTAVLEESLLGLLHLNDEAAAVPGHAVDVEYRAAVSVAVAKVLAVEILDVLYLMLAVVEQGIEETDEQILVHLSAEKLLETEVGIRIDVFLCCIACHNRLAFIFSAAKLRKNE